MGFRLIVIIAVALFFTGRSTYLSVASLEIGEAEIQEISEAESVSQWEKKTELLPFSMFLSLLPILCFSYGFGAVLSRNSQQFCFLPMFRGPPVFSSVSFL
ncbi:hypothetical protein [Leptospira idonii]|uniref:Uncharacterized protein n=1 Tax=Leptospira idonii TaxID=1193500 RepID=A0A4R9LV25_9LEPT|nr:hypothetical protein [Leptospira idonii]TGN17875.1 hypothetical protein EHS15_15975 [Leptospira idonii]